MKEPAASLLAGYRLFLRSIGIERSQKSGALIALELVVPGVQARRSGPHARDGRAASDGVVVLPFVLCPRW